MLTPLAVRAQIRERDADLYESLEKVGFMHDWGDDDSGLFMKYLRRGSGYYIDVGAVQLLVDGKVKLRSGKGLEIKRFEKNGVELNDGTKLDADLVVLATGYGSMNQWAPVPPTYVGWQVCKSSLILLGAAVGRWAAKLISEEVADKVGKCWGLGSGTTKDPGPWEGELRNMVRANNTEHRPDSILSFAQSS